MHHKIAVSLKSSRPHLSNHQHLNVSPSPKRTPLKHYLATSRSLQQNKLQGISIDRRKKISMDKLYDEEVLPFKKNQPSTRQPSEVSRMTPTSFSSKKNISFLEGSEYSYPTSRNSGHMGPPRRIAAQKQQEILQVYYEAQPVFRRQPQQQFKFTRSPPKRYDLRGIIKY